MKTNFSLAAIFILIIASTIFSQAKQISSSEFYKINSDAGRSLSERSRRIVVKTDTLENGAIVSSVTKTEERLLPDKMRFLYVEKTGDKETITELITIGTMEYRRENNGQWTARDISRDGYGTGNGTGGNVACMQYTEESDFVNGVPARKFRQLIVDKTYEGLSYEDFTVWVDQKGSFLRSEKNKGLLDPKIEKSRSTAIYEYESDMKIEAPIIKN